MSNIKLFLQTKVKNTKIHKRLKNALDKLQLAQERKGARITLRNPESIVVNSFDMKRDNKESDEEEMHKEY